ncbi:MAG: AI-2E family transporter, partial [Prevotella sp.]|nr:AI-2E family transporter [Prevotella sp.]
MIEEKITFDRFIRWMIIVLIVVGVYLIVSKLSSVLLPFFVAWFLAYLIYPMVKFVENKMRVRNRVISIVLTLIFLIAVITGVVWLIIPPMIEQFSKLGPLITKYLQLNTQTNDLSRMVRDWIADNQEAIQDFIKQKDLVSIAQQAMPKVFSVLGQTANIIISIVASVITLLYMFFILLDYEYLTENWIRIFPKKARPFWSSLMGDVSQALNSYIRGQGLVALTMGILFCIGFTIINFPMAIGLGILIGIMDLVPYLHTFALIPTAFLALLKAAD